MGCAFPFCHFLVLELQDPAPAKPAIVLSPFPFCFPSNSALLSFGRLSGASLHFCVWLLSLSISNILYGVVIMSGSSVKGDQYLCAYLGLAIRVTSLRLCLLSSYNYIHVKCHLFHESPQEQITSYIPNLHTYLAIVVILNLDYTSESPGGPLQNHKYAGICPQHMESGSLAANRGVCMFLDGLQVILRHIDGWEPLVPTFWMVLLLSSFVKLLIVDVTLLSFWI